MRKIDQKTERDEQPERKRERERERKGKRHKNRQSINIERGKEGVRERTPINLSSFNWNELFTCKRKGI